jgi:hypothetical protein
VHRNKVARKKASLTKAIGGMKSSKGTPKPAAKEESAEKSE